MFASALGYLNVITASDLHAVLFGFWPNLALRLDRSPFKLRYTILLHLLARAGLPILEQTIRRGKDYQDRLLYPSYP